MVKCNHGKQVEGGARALRSTFGPRSHGEEWPLAKTKSEPSAVLFLLGLAVLHATGFFFCFFFCVGASVALTASLGLFFFRSPWTKLGRKCLRLSTRDVIPPRLEGELAMQHRLGFLFQILVTSGFTLLYCHSDVTLQNGITMHGSR